jgi:hypothetical protein
VPWHIGQQHACPFDPSTPAGFYTKLRKGAPPVPTKEYVRREPDANSYSNNHVTDDYVEAILKIAMLPKMQEAEKKGDLLRDQFISDKEKIKMGIRAS